MGEQSLRALRGRRSEDVLFAGGRGRPPAGFAEVSMTFDAASANGRPSLALTFAELSVARRAYRSGENEYYLNRDRVRFRDIADLFGQVGLDLGGFAVVGQGTVDSALSLRPSDRRALVEQAAGTGYLQVRLEDSRARLDQTEQNLARVADLLSEINPRLKTLERQAKLARERDAMQQEYWGLALRWYGHQFARLTGELQGASAALDEAQSAVATTSDALDACQLVLQASQLAVTDLEQSLSAALNDHARAGQTLTQLRQNIAATQNILVALNTRRHELITSVAHWQTMLDDERKALDTAVQRRDSIAIELDAVESELDVAERDLQSWQTGTRDMESRRSESQRRLADIERALVTSTTRLQIADDRLSQVTRLIAERTGRKRSVEAELNDTERKVTAARHEAVNANSARDELERRHQEAIDARARAQRRLGQDIDAIAVIERDLVPARLRVDALRATDASGAGFYPGVRAIIRATTQQSPIKLAGIVGIVSKLIQVDQSHELAIEVALSGHAQDVVVEEWHCAEAAIGYLKAGSLGRATFLPLDALRPPRAFEPPTGPGIVGVGAALVRMEPRLQAVGEFLLGQTLVVDSLSTARRVVPRVPAGWQIVTLGGDIARSSGSVTGGAKPTNYGVLARYRENREASKAVNELTSRLERLSDEVRSSEEAARKSTSVVAGLDSDLVTSAEACRRRTAELAETEGRHRRLMDQVSWEDADLERLQAEATTWRVRRTEHLAQIDTDRTAQMAAESELRSAEEALSRVSDDVQVLSTRVSTSRLKRDRLCQQIDNVAAELSRVSIRVRSIEVRVAETQRQIEHTDAEKLAAEENLEPSAKELVTAEERASAVEREATWVRGALADRRAERDSLANRRRASEQALVAGQKSVSDAQKRAEHLTLELTGLCQQVSLELGPVEELGHLATTCVVTLPNGDKREQPIEPVIDAERLRERSLALRSKLRAYVIGPDVIVEYENLRQRAETLSAQLGDLSRTATTLAHAIAEIRETMQRRFAATFSDVSARFAARFADLFGGGSARLVVESDGDSPGVDIFAQPPGKRTQGLATLSGGERALTAAALLFSLIETNPPPFCVLDEVDAALDETNVVRFSGSLRELASRTQFVVITHNRRTMEAASVIYGLTLQDQCETRLLSMRLPNGYESTPSSRS
jgi:chromosome segregation protein